VSEATYRGRFAPSPTGDLHLGSIATALVAWASARAAGGRLVLRVEDIDTPRVVPGSEARQLDDLRWLGLDWDEGPDVGGPHSPYRQSERSPRYEGALARLADQGLLYYCDCSRAEIAAVASAPHPGDEGPRYPGTCRPFGMTERTWKRPPAIRLRVPEGRVAVEDRLQGRLAQDVAAEVGDFVLKRADGVYAYQLACVADDLAMGITEVVRGADLLGSTPRQVLLAELLGGTAPGFAHVPLVVHADGTRLAKRARGVTLRDHRDAGTDPKDVLELLLRTLGLPVARSARSLLEAFDRRLLAGRREARLVRAEARPAS
jgi:glutamyl-tRNA synthetase